METRMRTVLAASQAAYALLLRLCPAAYRRAYAPLMLQAFRDLAREAYRQHGTAGLVALWARALPDALAAALACPVAYIWPRRPAVLWGAWLTAGCLAVAAVLEAALWVSSRRRLLVACAAEGPGAPPPAVGGAEVEGPGPTRGPGPGRRRRKALLVPLAALAVIAGAVLLVSAVLGWPLADGGADGAYGEACGH